MSKQKTPIKTPIQETKVKESQKKPATGYIVETPVDGVKPSVPPGVYYDWNPIMSKNRLFSFVVGIRGGGKSYGATKFAINAYLKRGKKSIWLRRQATEIDDVFLRSFFREIATNCEFPGYDFMVAKSSEKGINFGYIKQHDETEWHQFMLFLPLSTALKHKSAFDSSYDLIWFDEFIINPKIKTMRYLDGWNEPITYFELLESVIRTRKGVRCIFIGNALSSANPYFTFLKIEMKKSDEWTMTEFAVIHNYKNDAFVEFKKKSEWGRFLETTEYGQYNMHNEFVNETDDFIERPTKNAHLLYNIRYMGFTYGVFMDFKEGKVFVDDHTDQSAFTWALTTDDMQENSLMIDRFTKGSTNGPSGVLSQAFKKGYLRFSSQPVLARLQELLMKIC